MNSISLSIQCALQKDIQPLVAVLEEHGSLLLEKGQDLATSYSCYKIYVSGFGKTNHNVTNDILRNTDLKF